MKLKLIVPNVNGNTMPVAAYGKAIAGIAGGFTAHQATGGWVSESGELIVEPVTVFDCDVSSTRISSVWAIRVVRDDIRQLARRIGRELSQQCVYLSIDDIVEYIKP